VESGLTWAHIDINVAQKYHSILVAIS
jgi:hypothetical protein